jgi:hypothetical protein
MYDLDYLGQYGKQDVVRTGLIATILWVALFAFGLAKTIWTHEWEIALFCGVFLGIGLAPDSHAPRIRTPTSNPVSHRRTHAAKSDSESGRTGHQVASARLRE